MAQERICLQVWVIKLRDQWWKEKRKEKKRKEKDRKKQVFVFKKWFIIAVQIWTEELVISLENV